MKTFQMLLVAAAAALAAVACGDSNAPDPTANARPTATVKPAPGGAPAGADDLATARADYAQFCLRCHKVDGTGGPFELEEGGTLRVPSLLAQGRNDSDARLAEQIRDGGDGMPPFKNRLDEKRIGDLVRFIRREFHGR
jgi:mono/diheme cytochrome c family protein